MKRLADGDFMQAWGGIASLQLGLMAVWTGAVAHGVDLKRLAGWLAEAPARLAGLRDRKGTLAEGMDADLVVWDPEAESTVDAAALYHRHPVTPYAGTRLRGAVRTTMLRGEIVFEDGECRGRPRGHLL
jgi:allantoinase